MSRKGLLIGIDYTEKYCMACWFNEKRSEAENVTEPDGSGSVLIPSVLCFDEAKKDWLIGEAAKRHAASTGAFLYTDLLTNTLAEEKYVLNGEYYPYSALFSVFIARLTDLALRCAGTSLIENINITVRRINPKIRQTFENTFEKAGIDKSRVHLLSYPESFAYFIIQLDGSLWADGAELFDFSEDGFFLNRLTFSKEKDAGIVFVNELNYSLEFSVKDVRNIVMRPRLDEKFSDLYESVKDEGARSSVYFTGSGFDELWFSNTLKNISQSKRAFRGNNIYAKGACLKGLLSRENADGRLTVVCRAKTRAFISVQARYKGQAKTAVLSDAAQNWYEAEGSADFILDESGRIVFTITSLLSREKTDIEFDLINFPKRPPKTTRVRISVKYLNEYECEICVEDLGFGGFFEASGVQVRKILNLEGYI